MVSDYGRLLQLSRAYAARAARISALARDISQMLSAQRRALRAALAAARAPRAAAAVRVAFQAPCTLQHALKVSGVVEPLLRAAGFTLTAVTDGQQLLRLRRNLLDPAAASSPGSCCVPRSRR